MDKSKRSPIQRLPAAFRILTFVLVAVGISFLFPADLRFKYQYEKQQVWRYDNLEAPFDFAIRKTDEEIAQERNAVMAHSTPVFVLDERIAKERKKAFTEQFEQQVEQARRLDQFKDVPRRPQKYLNYGLAFLDRLLARGIVKLSGEQLDLPPDQVVAVFAESSIKEQTLENLLDLQTAKSIVSDSLPFSSLTEPEFLLPLLQEQLQANLFYSPERTQQVLDEALGKIVTSRGLVQKGDIIITQNSIITEKLYQILYSYEQEYQNQVTAQRSFSNIFFGYLLLTILTIFLLAMYLRKYMPYLYNRLPKLIFIMMWLVIFSYVVYLIENTEGLNSYLIPFCIVPIVIKAFYNEHLALFTHIMTVLLTGFIFSLGFEFVFLQILAGVVVMLSSINTRDWSGFFYAIFFIFLSYALGYLGLALIRENSLATIDWSVYTWFFLNAFLTLLAYPLIPLLERVFGFVSPITLVELMDMNQPLLRDLAMKAPGTLQHSLQVGNLAETAARRIGADPLLVKVAALYHDIGKIKNPAFFIENQPGYNPHDKLTPRQSARIIISHVPDGIAMAKKAGLPSLLIDFIHTHHGDTRTEYFYRKYLEEKGKALTPAEEAAFHYPGPRPRSKEEAILMMADSIEAACKSLDHPTEEDLFCLIDKIIDGKLKTGQLKDSVINFRELEQCRQVFRQIMKSIHHVRVAYPEEE